MNNLTHVMTTALCTLATGGGCLLESGEPEPGTPTMTGEHTLPAGGGVRGAGVASRGSQPQGLQVYGRDYRLRPPTERTNAATISPPTATLNGSSINGPLINGGAAPGSEVYGTEVPGTNAGGRALSGLVVQGSGLTTVRVFDGKVLVGDELVGATFATQMPDGSPISLRIDGHTAELSDHHVGSVIHLYTLSYRPSGVIGWKPVCGQPGSAAVPALPLVSRWSYAQGVPGGGARLDAPDWITFACSGFALYKCVRLGYEPWTTAGGVRLDGHHQACLRLHRADYCGNGRPYTVDGHPISLFDALGIQDDTDNWSLEAAWDANGARCLDHIRIDDMTADCGLPRCSTSPDWSKTLLVSEVP